MHWYVWPIIYVVGLILNLSGWYGCLLTYAKKRIAASVWKKKNAAAWAAKGRV